MSETRNIYQRIHDVMTKVSYVQKGDKKVNGQYNFVSHDQVVAKLRPALVDAGIVCTVSVAEHAQDGNRTEAVTELKLVNIDNPEDFVVVRSFGYGIDPQDKGPGKAVSYAVKYGLLKTFSLETGDDPDNDVSQTHQPKPVKEAPAAEKAKAENPGNLGKQLLALANAICFDATDIKDMLGVFGIKKFGDLSETEQQKFVDEMNARVKAFHEIMDTYLSDATPGEEPDKAKLVDMTIEYLQTCAVKHDKKPLRVTAAVWNKWAADLKETLFNERSKS